MHVTVKVCLNFTSLAIPRHLDFVDGVDEAVRGPRLDVADNALTGQYKDTHEQGQHFFQTAKPPKGRWGAAGVVGVTRTRRGAVPELGTRTALYPVVVVNNPESFSTLQRIVLERRLWHRRAT